MHTSAAQLSAPSHPSAAQLAANATNAQHSTGPRTPEGKAAMAQNALKHGLFAQSPHGALEALGEDTGEFIGRLAALRADCRPKGQREEELVREIAALGWRLARLQHFAHGSLAAQLDAGEDIGAALQASEAFAPAEARLQRALSRVHRDLVFLQRFRWDREARQAAAHAAARRDRKQRSMRDMMASFEADTERLVQALHRRPMPPVAYKEDESEMDAEADYAEEEMYAPDEERDAAEEIQAPDTLEGAPENAPESAPQPSTYASEGTSLAVSDQPFTGKPKEQTQNARIGQTA